MDNQTKLLHFIHRYREQHEISPSMREMAQHLDMSIGSMQDYKKALLGQKLLKNPAKNIPRGLTLTEDGLAIVTKRRSALIRDAQSLREQ